MLGDQNSGEALRLSRAMGALASTESSVGCFPDGGSDLYTELKKHVGVHQGKNVEMLQQEREQNVWGQGVQRENTIHFNLGSKLLVLSMTKAQRTGGGGDMERGLER